MGPWFKEQRDPSKDNLKMGLTSLHSDGLLSRSRRKKTGALYLLYMFIFIILYVEFIYNFIKIIIPIVII